MYSYLKLRKKMKSMQFRLVLLCSIVIVNQAGVAQPISADSIVESYASISLTYDSDDELSEHLGKLLLEAEKYKDANMTDASAWLSCARIRFGYANAQGPVAGMKLISESRDELERAVRLDPTVDQGYALALMGYLYSAMPRWPISFGDKEKGWDYMHQAFEVDKMNVANNYFMAAVLLINGRADEAQGPISVAKMALSESDDRSQLSALYDKNIDMLYTQISKKRSN